MYVFIKREGKGRKGGREDEKEKREREIERERERERERGERKKKEKGKERESIHKEKIIFMHSLYSVKRTYIICDMDI